MNKKTLKEIRDLSLIVAHCDIIDKQLNITSQLKSSLNTIKNTANYLIELKAKDNLK